MRDVSAAPHCDGWWVLSVGTIAMALGSGLSMSAFGLYVKPRRGVRLGPRARCSLGFSGRAGVRAHGAADRPLVDSRGALGHPHRLAAGALSHVLLASTQTLWQYYLFYGFHALALQMMFFLPFPSLMSQWFDRKRGVALSILGSGFSLGSFLVLPVVAIVIGGLGWRGAYLFSGAIVAAFFIPVSLLVIRNRPADKGLHVDGLAERVDDAGVVMRTAANTGMTLRQAMKLPVFWIYGAGFMLLFYGMMGWQLHQVPFYESVGMSRATAASIVSMSAALSIVARLSMGVLSARFERFEGVAVVLFACLFMSMLTLLIARPRRLRVHLLLGDRREQGPMVESLVLIKAFGAALRDDPARCW